MAKEVFIFKVINGEPEESSFVVTTHTILNTETITSPVDESSDCLKVQTHRLETSVTHTTENTCTTWLHRQVGTVRTIGDTFELELVEIQIK